MIRGRKESSRKFTCYQRTLQMAAFPRYVVLVFLLLEAVVAGVHAAEAAKSAFGEAFDEIVVESTLTVRGKTPGRQSRNKAIAVETSTVGTSTAAAVAANVGEVKRTKRQHLEPHGPRIDTEGHNKLHGASQTYTTLLRSGFPAAAATVSLSRSGFGLDPGATSRGSHGKGASSGAASVTITDHSGNIRNYYG